MEINIKQCLGGKESHKNLADEQQHSQVDLLRKSEI